MGIVSGAEPASVERLACRTTSSQHRGNRHYDQVTLPRCTREQVMTLSTITHYLDSSIAHYNWDNSRPPRLEIASGDTVIFDVRGGGDNYFNRQSTAQEVLGRQSKGHALNGPIYV